MDGPCSGPVGGDASGDRIKPGLRDNDIYIKPFIGLDIADIVPALGADKDVDVISVAGGVALIAGGRVVIIDAFAARLVVFRFEPPGYGCAAWAASR